MLCAAPATSFSFSHAGVANNIDAAASRCLQWLQFIEDTIEPSFSARDLDWVKVERINLRCKDWQVGDFGARVISAKTAETIKRNLVADSCGSKELYIRWGEGWTNPFATTRGDKMLMRLFVWIIWPLVIVIIIIIIIIIIVSARTIVTLSRINALFPNGPPATAPWLCVNTDADNRTTDVVGILWSVRSPGCICVRKSVDWISRNEGSTQLSTVAYSSASSECYGVCTQAITRLQLSV